jgi:LPXTG-motif cell wall-anchored protein
VLRRASDDRGGDDMTIFIATMAIILATIAILLAARKRRDQ